jgi:hypothetical protein
MTGIPPPPLNFNSLNLVTESVATRQLLRIAWRDSASHVRFRRDAAYRFNAPDRSFGVLYAAFDFETAFAETVLRQRPMEVGAAVIPLDYAELDARVVVNLEGRSGDPRRGRPLVLIKLYDEGIVAARVDNSISSVDDYASTQRWGKAFQDHPLRADGIVYMSRFLGARKCVALFERAQEFVVPGRITPLLEHAELAAVLDRYQVAIDSSPEN